MIRVEVNDDARQEEAVEGDSRYVLAWDYRTRGEVVAILASRGFDAAVLEHELSEDGPWDLTLETEVNGVTRTATVKGEAMLPGVGVPVTEEAQPGKGRVFDDPDLQSEPVEEEMPVREVPGAEEDG